uniref:mitogen-activated protein kinase kinase kinase n=1 Tax=Kalanchoe fedtschenkoi TaxID=63787 RepID=A0A7N0V6Y0_KALFE
MQEILGSVRKSLVFRGSTTGDNDGVLGGLVDKIGSSIRKSRIGLFSRPPALPAAAAAKKDDAVPIRWRKGELIGWGAFGRVYMGMNLDSGELLAIKQVSIAVNSASKEKTQAHIKELEEEVKLLKNLSHPNIVRYMGTAREDDSLNILLEFVPGGSISSLLGKFGSFPEPVIRMYTKQLLLGLTYLHKNGIMHRDIKGANILVDNKGRIKLADFGASKKVVELATMTGAKSMKGTPYWMAPEVIVQTGHSFSADIWSVGCTVIEMATGKPPWSQQYQEVAALFHIGTTKSHPPIPEHLSSEAKDFLLRCLQKEPDLRASAAELLQHPFVTGECQEERTEPSSLSGDKSRSPISTPKSDQMKSTYLGTINSGRGLKELCEMGSVRCSIMYPENSRGKGFVWGVNSCDDDMCMIDDKDEFEFDESAKLKCSSISGDCYKSFNPVTEPNEGQESFNFASLSGDISKSLNPICEQSSDWPCKFDLSPELPSVVNLSAAFNNAAGSPGTSDTRGSNFVSPCGHSTPDDDDEVTETKIRAFLDEKALDLKKLQTPLFEEFYNTLNTTGPPAARKLVDDSTGKNSPILPPKSKSPSWLPGRRLSSAVNAATVESSLRRSKRASNVGGGEGDKPLREIQSPEPDEWKDLIVDQEESISLSSSFYARQQKWKEELDKELEMKREKLRKAGGKVASPKDHSLSQQRDQIQFALPGR